MGNVYPTSLNNPIMRDLSRAGRHSTASPAENFLEDAQIKHQQAGRLLDPIIRTAVVMSCALQMVREYRCGGKNTLRRSILALSHLYRFTMMPRM